MITFAAMRSKATPRARTRSWYSGATAIPVRTTIGTGASVSCTICFGLAILEAVCIFVIAHDDLVGSNGSIYFHNPDQSSYYWIGVGKGYSRYVSPDGQVSENYNPNLQGASVRAAVCFIG